MSRTQRRHTRASLIPVAVLLLSACQYSPRDGQELPHRGTRFQMSGATVVPNDTMYLYQQNQITGEWIGTTDAAVSSSSPDWTDPQGVSWFTYANDNARLLYYRYLWRSKSAVDGQRRISTDVRTYSPALDTKLTSFDVDADECISNHINEGGMAVINNCQSHRTPEAEIIVPCGKPDQDCCVAHNIPEEDECDRGRICGYDSRCSVPAGGVNQACNADGSCNSGLSCVADTCRDTTIEDLPLITLDLQVTTCDDSSWLSNSRAPMTIDLGGDRPVYVDIPGDQLKLGQTDTFGLRVPGIETLGDIRRLHIRIYEDNWCFDRIRLLANNREVFDKSWSRPVYMNARYPHSYDEHRISRTELRDDWLGRNSDPHCTPPSTISGNALERTIEGTFGHAIGEDPDLAWGSDGWLTVERSGSTDLLVRARVKGTQYIEGWGDVDAYAWIRTNMHFNCTNTSDGASIDIDMDPFSVDDVETVPELVFLNIFTTGLAETAVEAITQNDINEKTGSLADNLSVAIDGLPLCPPMSFGSDPAPPDLNVTLPNLDLTGLMCQ